MEIGREEEEYFPETKNQPDESRCLLRLEIMTFFLNDDRTDRKRLNALREHMEECPECEAYLEKEEHSVFRMAKEFINLTQAECLVMLGHVLVCAGCLDILNKIVEKYSGMTAEEFVQKYLRNEFPWHKHDKKRRKKRW